MVARRGRRERLRHLYRAADGGRRRSAIAVQRQACVPPGVHATGRLLLHYFFFFCIFFFLPFVQLLFMSDSSRQLRVRTSLCSPAQWAVVNLSCPLDRKPIPPEALVKLSLFNNVRLHTSIFLEEVPLSLSHMLRHPRPC